jgi:hypothetical protein
VVVSFVKKKMCSWCIFKFICNGFPQSCNETCLGSVYDSQQTCSVKKGKDNEAWLEIITSGQCKMQVPSSFIIIDALLWSCKSVKHVTVARKGPCTVP